MRFGTATVRRLPRQPVPAATSVTGAGTPAPLVAGWAGHTVEVLFRILPYCIDGDDERLFAGMEEALDQQRPPARSGPDGTRSISACIPGNSGGQRLLVLHGCMRANGEDERTGWSAAWLAGGYGRPREDSTLRTPLRRR